MSNRLPMLKARDVMRVLHSLGFMPLRQAGSHIFYKHPDGRTTLIPKHDGEDIGRGLMSKILNEVGIKPDEFSNYL